MTTPVWGIGSELSAARLNLRPYAHVIQSVSQNLTTVNDAPITFDIELLDPYGVHSIVSNTSRITPGHPGYYDFEGMAAIGTNITGDRRAQFRKNGANLSGAPYFGIPSPKSINLMHSTPFAMATIACNGTTDFVELWAIQDSGSTLATIVTATGTRSFMRCRWVAPL